MDVWTLSVEANAAAFMGVWYGNILTIYSYTDPTKPSPHQRLLAHHPPNPDSSPRGWGARTAFTKI